MALPTIQDAKDYLRVDSTSEDPLILGLLQRAQASIERHVGYPMAAVSTTYVDYNRGTCTAYLQLPGPFASSPTPTVTDVDGVAVDATTYLLDGRSGKIRSKYGTNIFGPYPYTVVATIGLSAHPDYDSRIETVATIAILDLVAHFYQNRNPMIADDLGQGANDTTPAIPARIVNDLMQLPCSVVCA